MKSSVNTLEKSCTGCGACACICSKNAISIQLDEKGFFTAKVDDGLCVDCGKCISVCIRNGVSNADELLSGKMISAQSTNSDVVHSCSSGGIAYEFSRYAVEKQWTVAGVVYDYSDNTAKTVLANSLDEIEPMKGSKYIQSYTEEAFRDLIDYAKIDKECRFLVVGTPCQIYGFASLTEELKLRDRFILLDLFCHGVPSYLVWQNYLKSIRKKIGNGKINEVVFRDKSIGWHNFVIKVDGNDGKYLQSSEGDLFYKVFFDNVLLSSACFNCPVRQQYSKADIRLGDCWGKRYQNREDGVSAVLCLTKQGKEFFEAVPNIEVFENLEISEVLSAQSVKEYKEVDLHNNAISELMSSNNLKRTITHYRKSFGAKRRLKLKIKESTAHLPDGVRARIRKVYKNI